MSVHTIDLHADELADRIADLIAALGDTADAIAYRLAEAGITGRRADAMCCPIANYLRHHLPCIEIVDVCGDAIDVWTVTGEHACLRAPDEVEEFVSLSDIERYPDLLLTGRQATR